MDEPNKLQDKLQTKLQTKLQSGLQSSLPIADFPVCDTTRQELATLLLAALCEKRKLTLFFANTNFIVKCRFLLQRMRDRAVLIVNDGVGMDIASLLCHGRRFRENLNGTDFTPFLFQCAAAPLRVYMVGGRPEVLIKAAEHVHVRLGQVVVGGCDGYDGIKDAEGLIADINQARPDLVLVALGNPIQEQWILQHRQVLDASLMMGVGALFDFWAGDKSRAPGLVQKLRLEWLYRLALEPRRLLRRYTVDICVFLAHCHKYRSIHNTPPSSAHPL
jgi:beta-1,4-glucosyltransferase